MKMVDVSAEVATALTSSGICEASLEAEVLVRYVLDMDRVDYFSSLTETFKQSEEYRLNSLVCRRMSGEPLAYILGCREFYGLNLVVDKNVLVPRQETESLAEEVIEFVRT
ncbi:peptide chain release factor N(5)-glutamine methyltransferase, partial [Dehalococcoidia bacterium]|nr:peptide chain release factor N(5)-glutamine methyltransferase [Dehalococcoidia bacterium]